MGAADGGAQGQGGDRSDDQRRRDGEQGFPVRETAGARSCSILFPHRPELSARSPGGCGRSPTARSGSRRDRRGVVGVCAAERQL